MNSTLKPGHWCRPKDENEWKAILDLAEALGIKRRFANQRLPYHEFDCVMFYVGVYAAAYGAHDKEIFPSDFIRGMYALAGQKEPCRPGVEQRLDDHEKRIKALEDEHDMGESLKDGPWHIHIDPEACPKGIPFSVALEYLKAGRKVRRAHWADGAFAYMGNSTLIMNYTESRAGALLGCGLLGNGIDADWEVIPES